MPDQSSIDSSAGGLLLSVIMPLYNKESSVARAIASVLAQDNPHFELILVDDGSTDRGYLRAKAFVDPRIKLLQQSNQGVAVARNMGAQVAKGDYLCFLDADDQYLPTFLTQIAALIKLAPEAALYSCRFDVIDESGRLLTLRSHFPVDFSGPVTDFFATYRQERSLICASSFAIRRDLLFAIGGFPAGIRIGEDIFVWLKAALTGPVMHSAKSAAVIYQNAENRTIHLQQQELAWHLVYFLRDRHWAQNLPVQKAQQLDRFVRYNLLVSAFGALRYGRRDVARGYARLIKPFSPGRAALIYLASLMPLRFFTILRYVRNQLSAKTDMSV